jgi:hypothetical protein
MSLRLRLTLLYTTLLGGVLLIFGALVYGMVSVVLLDQVDATLEQSAERIITRLRVTPTRDFDPAFSIRFPAGRKFNYSGMGSRPRTANSSSSALPSAIK